MTKTRPRFKVFFGNRHTLQGDMNQWLDNHPAVRLQHTHIAVSGNDLIALLYYREEIPVKESKES